MQNQKPSGRPPSILLLCAVRNGVANLAEEPLLRAERGETVNSTGFAHPMHVHGHHFRVIERSGSQFDDGRPWRDTFLVGPDQTTKLAFVADNPGKWLLHCHMLEHAAAGMNTWFEVVSRLRIQPDPLWKFS